MEGYIKLHRKFFENLLWREPREYSRAEAWLDLIQSVRFDSSSVMLNSRAIEIHRGEMAASRRYLEQRWGWGSTKVNNFLDMLKANRMISTRQTSGQTILKLSNYEHYNDSQTILRTRDKPTANQRQTGDKPNIKNENKVKKESIFPDGNSCARPQEIFLQNEKIGDSMFESSGFEDSGFEGAYCEDSHCESVDGKLLHLGQSHSERSELEGRSELERVSHLEDSHYEIHPQSSRKKVAQKKERNFDLSFIPERWQKIIEDWLGYRCGIAKPYRTQQGVEQFYNQLVNLSGGDGTQARKIINKAISNEWQGIGEHCKEESKNGKKRDTNIRKGNSISDLELAEAIAEGAQRGHLLRRERGE